MEAVLVTKEKFVEIGWQMFIGPHPKVYFVRSEDYIKIGTCANDLTLRLSDLQCGNPHKLELEHFMPGGRDLEKEFHKGLNKLKYRGEWFKITPMHLTMVIREFRKTGKIKP